MQEPAYAVPPPRGVLKRAQTGPSGAFTHRRVKPPSHLSHCIEHFWLVQWDFADTVCTGEAHVQRGAGGLTALAQTEEVEYKLDGFVLVIEGTGQAQTDQRPSLEALGVISYDDATGAYRIRAWNDGRFLESEVQLLEDGKSLRWGFGVGEIRSSSLLQIDKDGQWTEKAELTIGSQPPRKLMDLTVRRK